MKNKIYALVSLIAVYACFNFYAYTEIDNLIMSHNAIVMDMNALLSQIDACYEANKNLAYGVESDILFSKNEIDSMKMEMEANKKRIHECSNKLDQLKSLRCERFAQIEDANRMYSNWILVKPNTKVMIY